MRAAAAVALVIGEYLVQAVLFDGSELARRGGWGTQVSSLGEVVTVGCVVLTAGVLLSRRELVRALRTCVPEPRPVSAPWLAVHVALFGVSALSLGYAFSASANGSAALVVLLLLWLSSVAGSMVALGCALFRGGVWRAAAVLLRIALAGLVLGSIAWAVALASRQLWPWLARQTLSLSAWGLSLFAARVDVDVEHASLGVENFYVDIAPQCSGIEGVALVGVFVAGYLFESRRSLRFPRVLVLLPLAMLAAWFANAVRLVALIALGAWVSPDVALGGFHSKAGWLLFCGIALTIVFVTQRTSYFSRIAALPSSECCNPTAAYCLPLLCVIAVSLATATAAVSVDLWYAPRVIVAALLLWFFRNYYTEYKRTPGWESPLIGVTVFAVWLVLCPSTHQAQVAEFKAVFATLSPDARIVWIAVRVVGSVITTPIIEELAFRGYLQRRLVSAQFTEVSLRRVNVLALVGAAVLFGGLHQAWIAGTLAGIAYSLACRRRGRLIDAIAAHATTNALIAVWVLTRDRWDLWF